MSRARLLLLGLITAAVLGLPAGASAQVCTFSQGPSTVNFASYSSASATPTDTTSTFQFVCNPGNPRVTVTLSTGAGTFAQRQMTIAGFPDRLNYNLYQDAARTIIWGDGTPPSQSDRNDRENRFYTIYGRIPAGQWVAAGTYRDTIIITLNY